MRESRFPVSPPPRTERLANVITGLGASTPADPMCQVYLFVAATYLLELLILLRRGHRPIWFCLLLVPIAYVAAAFVHGPPHP